MRYIDLLKGYGLLAMFADKMMSQPFAKRKSRYRFPTDEELEKKKVELKLKRGLKWFNIDGQEILALNHKNAVRKANLYK